MMRRNKRVVTTILIFILISTASNLSLAREVVEIFLGQVRVMQIGRVERVAIGNPKIASNTILPNGQLVLLGDSAGATTVHIWMAAGGEKEFDVVVREKTEVDKRAELDRLLGEVGGLNRIRLGDLVIVRGRVESSGSKLYDRILELYKKEIIDLTKRGSSVEEVRQLLDSVPGVSVKEAGQQTVISGEVSKEFAPVIQAVAGKYPKVLNLTRTRAAIAGKMVYMKVRIMEMGRSFLEKVGIDWTALSGIAGPSFQFGVETTRNQGTILNSGVSEVLTKPGGESLTSARGYFGIATGLSSVLNFYETTGDAVTLAEPRLSARSGGSAEFLAGGEIPLPVSRDDGYSSVEFKKYGISLNIKPVVDSRNNILAHLETEVSAVDQANGVQGVPAFKTRKTTTDISMRERQTLVIAGLLNDQSSKDFNNLPYLSDIPILGKLFSSREYQNGTTELVVFVTPTIYDADSELNRNQLKRMEDMERKMKEIISNKGLMD